MAKIVVTAHACKFSAGSMTYMPFDPPLARETVDVRNVADINAAEKALGDRVGATHKTSFNVSSLMARGERAVPGFNKRAPYLPYNRDV